MINYYYKSSSSGVVRFVTYRGGWDRQRDILLICTCPSVWLGIGWVFLFQVPMLGPRVTDEAHFSHTGPAYKLHNNPITTFCTTIL